nr:hypothetical protein [Tanacetum cinerariifolium]
MQTQTSNTLHNAITEAGSKDRPPMLAPGNYVQWRSRIKRYIDTKPNHELIYHCFKNPPYKFTWADKEVPIFEGSPVTRTESYMETYKTVSHDIRDKLNAEAEAVQIILTRIDNDIYSTVDACPNACEMWKAIERSQQAATMNRGKAIVTSPQPIYDQEPSIVAEDDEMLKDKEIDKLMDLISLSFKKIYKPTNNNLRTSSNTSRENQDNSLRINRSTGYENQRIGNSARARETVGSTLVKDAAYHREKMLLCKQEEAGIQLNAEQADWRDDTDDEMEDQELEAHYIEEIDQNDDNNDLDNERELLASLIEKLKCEIDEITAQTLPPNKKSILKNMNVLAPGMYKLHTDPTQARTSKLPQDSRKTNKHVSFSTGVILRTSVSRPQLKRKSMEDKVMRNNSQGKKHDLVEIVLFIVDSGSSKHMTRNLKLLINFVEKFLGMVKFRNDQIAPILGYGDLVQGGVIIKRVYYVEGLNHNLFSVGQFCDADLEVAFRKSTCYICDLKGNDLLTVIVDDYSRYTWTYFLRSKDETPKVLIDFLKLVQRGLQAQVRIVRTNKSTKFLNQTLHVYFAAEGILHQTLVARTPKLNDVVERQNRTLVEAARTMLSVAKVPLFFGAEAIATTCFTQNRSLEKGDACIFVEYSTQSRAYRVFNNRKRVIVETIHVNFDELPQMASDHVSSDPVPECPTMALEHVSLSSGPQCQENVTQADRTVTKSNELDLLFSLMFNELLNGSSQAVSKSSAVSTVDAHNQHQQQYTTPLNNQTTPDPSFENDEFINIFCTPIQDRGETSSHHVDSLDTEPKNIKEAMDDSAWIELMQEELYQFDQLDVWELVDRQLCKNVINMKCLWKNKRDEENTINQSPRGILLNQAKYAQEILIKHGMTSCDSVGTLMATKHLDADLSETPIDQTKYHSMVRALIYLTASRPDIMHATCYCARYQAKPTEKHLTAVKRIFRYLKDTIHMGLWYLKDTSFELTAFSDLDHAGCLDSRKSTSGGIQFLAIAISCNPVQHSRTKHIDVRYHFIKEKVKQGIVELFFVGTEYQLADLFTKALPEERFKYLVRRLGMRCLTPDELEILANEYA